MIPIKDREAQEIKNKNLTLKELIEKGIVKDKVCKCDSHGLYDAKPLCKYVDTVIYTGCPKCEEERKIREEKIKLEKQKEEEARREEEFIRNLRVLGCGRDYIEKRGKLSANTQLLSKVLPNGGTLKSFIENDGNDFIHKQNLFILGSCGIGKTFFACKLVDTALGIGKTYKIITGFELISIYSNSNHNGVMKINNSDNLAHLLDGLDCLIIDEIDFFLRDGRTAREKEVLEIITHITSKDGIRTIVLGNCSIEEMQVLDSKVLSRLASGDLINGWGMKDLRISK